MDEACPNGLQAFETIENLFNTEAETTARWMLTGRRYDTVLCCHRCLYRYNLHCTIAKHMFPVTAPHEILTCVCFSSLFFFVPSFFLSIL